jgi:RNA-directed DNA polymerase
MSNPLLLRSLARAFAAGQATLDDVISRAEIMLGRPWRWLRPVAKRYLRRFGKGLRPREREVVEFLRENTKRRKLRIAEWFTEPQLMRPVEAAAAWDVPAIESVGALAEWLRLHPLELAWFADLKGLARTPRLGHYHYRVLAKQGGRVRLIEAPKPRIKEIQRLILGEILEKIPSHPAVQGFVKGRSILTFVAPHVSRRIVIRIDLQDFFPSINGVRIQTVFRVAGYPESVADLLGGLCTNAVPRAVFECALHRRPHLPQGAPTSPALANICAYRMDCRLAGLAKAVGAEYTRYADDLAFSGDEAFERCVERFLPQAAAIAAEEGFVVNHRKTRVMRQGVRQHLAGLVTNSHANIIRPDFDRLKAILTNCLRLGIASQNRESHPDFRAHLTGKVAFVEMVNPEKGKRLRELLDRIEW